MAVQLIGNSAKAMLTLNVGTNPSTGKAITKSLTVSKLVTGIENDATEKQKLSDIIDLIAPVLLFPVANSRYNAVYTIEKI